MVLPGAEAGSATPILSASATFRALEDPVTQYFQDYLTVAVFAGFPAAVTAQEEVSASGQAEGAAAEPVTEPVVGTQVPLGAPA